MSGSSHSTGRAPLRRDNASPVYQQLRSAIVSGQLAPGTRLVEKELAVRFGVSRTPVRAALDRLEQEGYVVNAPGLKHSLSQVAPLTREDGLELFETLAALEGVAARHAALLPGRTRQDLAKTLKTINGKLRLAARRAQPSHLALHQLDTEFHQRIVEAAAGPRLRALLDIVRPQTIRYDQLYVVLLAHQMQPSLAEHAAIIAALEAGDAEAAQRAAEANQRNAGQRLAATIAAMGERGRW
jgi:DNA-binding GntR family transcriptional regulator